MSNLLQSLQGQGIMAKKGHWKPRRAVSRDR